MALFKKSISEELSNKLHGLVDDYAENVIDYISISEKIEDREELAEELVSGATASVIAALPIGMWLGSVYLDSLTGGATIGALVPASLGLGAGLISYFNRRDTQQLAISDELDKSLQSKHNAVFGKEFLEKLSEFNLEDAFNEIKEVVDNSIKNPPKFQENIGNEVRSILNKNKI